MSAEAAATPEARAETAGPRTASQEAEGQEVAVVQEEDAAGV